MSEEYKPENEENHSEQQSAEQQTISFRLIQGKPIMTTS